MIKIYDGRKAVSLLGDDGWVIHGKDESQKSADRLYSIVSWMYRCITLRGNGVASMPFVVKQNGKQVYRFDGLTPQEEPPRDIEWIKDLPSLLWKVEIAASLGGRAYLERRQNLSGTRDLFYDWLQPHSIVPIYNRVPNRFGVETDTSQPYGALLGFWRYYYNLAQKPIRFEANELVYFWYPDYYVESGHAVNFPGKSVLQNANVVGSMDMFLAGYFDRGMIKATLLKYKDNIKSDEAKRVKNWWKRIFSGISNAFATEVVRGDFETMTIGEGISDLRDNVLTKDEKDSIAVGLGIPPSKLLPVGVNRATKDGDDRSYIEDTIIPEIGWLYRVVNKQMLNPVGYSIVANPQELRVMQADENERASAFRQFVGSVGSPGLSVEQAIDVLGIHISEEFRQQIPQEKSSLDVIELMDKRDEVKRFQRWLTKNKNYCVDNFVTDLLSNQEKIDIAFKQARLLPPTKAQKNLQQRINDYTELLAQNVIDLVDDNLSREQMITVMSENVSINITREFRSAANIPDNESLTQDEQKVLDRIISVNLESISGFIDAVIDASQKGVFLDRIKDNLTGIGSRIEMWGNALRESFNLGHIWNRDEEKLYEWRLGLTEKHCADCLAQHLKQRTAVEWRGLAGILIYPQSRALACRGYNCDCGLYEV